MFKILDKDNNEIEYSVNAYCTKIFPLENFSAFGLEMDGIYFYTSEHAFQYLKFVDTNMDIANEIRNIKSPYEAREIAGKYKSERVKNWSDIKYDIMEKVIKLKVEQNKIVKECLNNTRGYTIVEFCEDEDTDWGLDKNFQGENNLGKILMKIRDEMGE